MSEILPTLMLLCVACLLARLVAAMPYWLAKTIIRVSANLHRRREQRLRAQLVEAGAQDRTDLWAEPSRADRALLRASLDIALKRTALRSMFPTHVR
ncbi:hypothetical protein [Stakelama marina]|uniref:Uncharacterized protein n=1 Tax=Stakelama marina TaxID=2826939 RepID=A0A8T4II92_9SPHN|nr:hypothetical protein [Stakelama marina]MBR0553762.1 hypothetical protein [Stakelama marina]